MKKIVLLMITVFLGLTLTACKSTSSETTGETVTITSLNSEKSNIEIEVPYDPQRIVVIDNAALDILDNLEVGDRVVGMASTSIEYLSKYTQDKNIANVGTIKEADLEEVMKCEPDIIFIGGRLAASYDALSEIAPVVYLSTDTEIGLIESISKNAQTIASIFGKDKDVSEMMKSFEERIEVIKTFANGKTAIIGMTTSGSFNILGNDGRCSIIGNELGFENVGTNDNSTSTHGNESSFEAVLSTNPDYLFVLDRDAAIGTTGVAFAKEIIENELVKKTLAFQNGNIVYLENSSIWYTAEGGITALDIMLRDIENSLLH